MLANALRADLGLHETPTLSSDLRHEVTCLIAVSGKLLGELAESLQRFTSCQLILLSPLMLLADEGHGGAGVTNLTAPTQGSFLREVWGSCSTKYRSVTWGIYRRHSTGGAGPLGV